MASRCTLVVKKNNKVYPIYIHNSEGAIIEHMVNLALANTFIEDEFKPLEIIKYGRLLKSQWRAYCSFYQPDEEYCLDEGCYYLNIDNKTYFTYNQELTTKLYHAKHELTKFKQVFEETIRKTIYDL